MDFHWTGVAHEGSVRLDDIRRHVQGAVDAFAPANPDLWRAIQAVDELSSNCMRHAYGLGNPGPIRVDVVCGDRKIRITIEDTGRPFEGSLERPLDFSASMGGGFGGLGLALTRLVVNEMNYERRGETNRWTVMLDLADPPKTVGKAMVPA